MLYLPDRSRKNGENSAKEKVERLIAERTADLSAAHQEITAQFEELRQSQDALQRSLHMQEVLREIADTALTAGSVEELYAKAHQSVVRVLPAKNFFIALLEPSTNEIIVPYCVDETNSIPRRRSAGKGLTEYVMHQGHAVLLTTEAFERLWQSGEVNLKYVQINEWLGAPLKKSSGEIFGVIALYSIGDAPPYEPEYTEAIAIIAAQVSMAIERRQMEEAMRESEERFANAFNFAVVGMALASPGGLWIKVNSALCRIFGYSEQEMLCRSVQDVTYDKDREESAEFRRRLLEKKIDHYQLEKRYIHKSGQVIWAKISVSLVCNRTGEPRFLVAQIEDISDRKRMETELRLHAGKLEETVALRTQELFASNQELTAVNQELTAMNEEMIAMNESLQVANEDLAIEVETRQQKETELMLREKQYQATTSLLTISGGDLSGFLRTILQDAIMLVGAPGGYIGLQDDSGKNFVVSHTVGADQGLVLQPRSIEEGMVGEVYHTGEILCVDDYRQYPNRIVDSQFEQSTTVIMVPLRMDGQVKGALAANWRDTVHPIGPEDIEILRQYGVLASIALERLHTGMQIGYQNQLLQGLAEMTAALVSELDLEKVLQNILDKAKDLTAVPHGFVLMINENNVHEVLFRAGYGRYAEKVGQSEEWHGGVFEEVLRTGQMIVVEDYVNWPHRNHESVQNGVTMSIHAPLKADGRIIGDIGLTAFGETVALSLEKTAALEQFASIASIAIKNALSHQKTNQLAFHDTLTGLPNRAHLNLRLEDEMRQARCGEAAGAVMFIDLDDLKTVNDHFGHTFGDDVIIAAGQDIAGAVGNKAYVARVGGDEFVVILPGEENLEHIAQIAERLVGAIRKEYAIRGQKVHMSTSVGVTRYPVDALTAEDVLKNADIAMYAAKASGKSNWCFYEPEMLKDSYDQMVLTNSLRHALERGELFLQYQPQVALSEKQVVGFEALLRWNSKEHGMIPPARFIPLAEQRGLIQAIGQWVIGEACRFARKLADLGRKDLHVAVNVSPRQLAAEGFVPEIQRCIFESGIEPGQFEVEITENVLIDSLEEGTKKLFKLSSLGIHLSLDDFGTGFSSLTYLRNLPVGTLKIDKSFIDKILNDKVQEGFIRSIIDMAHVLGLNVVAEGVETELQQLKLTEVGCDCMQGYVFSKPVSQEEAIRFAIR